MINCNDITHLDVSDIDLTKIDLGRFDVRNLDLQALPRLPRVELPSLPAVSLGADVERVAGLARDAAYAGVGVAVVAARKVDERRRELTGQVAARVREAVASVA